MESDKLHGDFMVKLMWRLSSNLVLHVFPTKPLRQSQKSYH